MVTFVDFRETFAAIHSSKMMIIEVCGVPYQLVTFIVNVYKSTR